jgi:hypothetical protein
MKLEKLLTIGIDCLICQPILTLCFIDLSIQFLKEADKYALDEIRNKPEKEINEYTEDV